MGRLVGGLPQLGPEHRHADSVPADDLAVMVWAELDAAGENGYSTWELRKRLDLTQSQIRKGIQRINHVLQECREQPIVFHSIRGRGYVYYLPEKCPDYRTFAVNRLRDLITRSRTEATRATAAILRWPQDIAPYVPKMLTRVVEDLDDLLRELKEPE